MCLDGERLQAFAAGRKAGRAELVLALCAVLALAACGEAPGESPGERAPAADAPQPPQLAPAWKAPPSTAGAEHCADCHQEIVESWSHTGMARALGPVALAEFAGLGVVRDEPTGAAYHYEVTAGTPRIVETSLARPDYRLAAEIVYAVGAGDVDRSLVARLGAFEWFSPLEIVSAADGRHTALAPGHMAVPDQRFSVAINAECLGCHTERLPPDAFPLNLHRGAAWQPRGISCAACHGAVERHAAWQEAELAGQAPAGVDPILRPEALDREQRMSLCAACHLEGDVRIAFNSRFGIPRPGGDLLDQRAVFVAAGRSDHIGFVSHVERLVLSACYLQSPSMSCTSCHDPHRSVRGDPEERARVRAACLDCHRDSMESDGAGSACSRPHPVPETDGDCVDCHMRRTPVYDVAEVRIHDHFIQTRPGPPSAPQVPRTQESPTGDWVFFSWPGRPPPASADDPGLWMMAYGHRGHPERARELLDTAPGPFSRALPMYHHTRGSLLEQADRPDEAAAAYERALQAAPGFPPSAINLGYLYGTRGQRDRGLAVLEEVLALHPEAVNALRNRAALRAEQGDLQGFVGDLTRAFELQPSAEVADILAGFYRDRRDPRQAAEWAARAAGLRP